MELVEGRETEREVVCLVQNRDDSTMEEERRNIFEDISANSDVLLEIFSRLAPPTVLKSGYVSNGLCNFIKEANFAALYHKNFKPLAGRAVTGFIFQEKEESVDPRKRKLYGTHFFPIESEVGGLPDPSLQFLKQKGKTDVVDIIDSCNGLLLCCNTTSRSKVETCFVCNPLTKEKVALPYVRNRPNMVSVCYALMADLEANYLKYKVICLNRPKNSDKKYTELSILFSETGKWMMELGEKLPPIGSQIVDGSRVFFNGSLYWDCLEDYILVCHLNVEERQPRYKLIQAPRAPLGRCLWKSEDKLHCCCNILEDDYDDVKDWTLSMDEESTWKLEDDKDFRDLTLAMCDLSTRESILEYGTAWHRFYIISYEPQSKTIFLFMPNLIYKYSFKQRMLYSVGDADTIRDSDLFFHSRLFPYVHSLLPFQTWSTADCEAQPITKMKVEARRKQRVPRLY